MSERAARKIMGALVQAAEWTNGRGELRVTLPDGEVRMMTIEEFTDWLEEQDARASLRSPGQGGEE